MENNTKKKNRGVGWGLFASLLVVALVVVGAMVSAGGDADNGEETVASVPAAAPARAAVVPSSVVAAEAEAVCAPGTEVKFFAYETTDAAFGPAVDPNTETVLQELHNRRCADPALVVAHEMYQSGDYLTEAGRDERIAHLASNRLAHDEAVAALEIYEVDAVSVTIEHINVENQSMWMLDTQPRPTIVAGPSNVPEFDALVFTYADGKREVYKLDCGFQPMAPSFPELPPIPPELVPPPPTTTPGTTTPPTTVTTPPTTVPVTTPPTTTVTTPPTTVPQVTTTTKPPYSTQPPVNNTVTPTVANTPAPPPPTAPPDPTPNGAVTVATPPPIVDSNDGATQTTVLASTTPPRVTATAPEGGGQTPSDW